jgi:uncharacterized protein DUF4160
MAPSSMTDEYTAEHLFGVSEGRLIHLRHARRSSILPPERAMIEPDASPQRLLRHCIYMYIRDHGPPHVHAWAAEQRAVVDIATGAVLAGDLKARQAARWSETGSTSTEQS